MKATTKILVGGGFVALVIGGAGLLNARQLERREAELIQQCEASPSPWEQFKATPAPPPGYMLDPLICDAASLIRSGTTEGLQGQIVDAHYQVAAANELPITLASIVIALSLIPWSWYFLLRRIGELRSALAGKPPSH